MNGVATISLAAYVIVVMVKGNEKALAAMLLEEGAFIKWAIAFGIVKAVSDKLGNVGGVLLSMVYIGMFFSAFRNNPNVLNNLTKILK